MEGLLSELVVKEDGTKIPFSPEKHLAKVVKSIVNGGDYKEFYNKLLESVPSDVNSYLVERFNSLKPNKMKQGDTDHSSFFTTPRIESQVVADKILRRLNPQIISYTCFVLDNPSLNDLLILNKTLEEGIINKKGLTDWNRKSPTQILDYTTANRMLPILNEKAKELKGTFKKPHKSFYSLLAAEFFSKIKNNINKGIVDDYLFNKEILSKDKFDRILSSFVKEYGTLLKNSFRDSAIKKEAENTESMTIAEANNLLQLMGVNGQIKNENSLDEIIKSELKKIINYDTEMINKFKKEGRGDYKIGDVIEVVKPYNGDSYYYGGTVKHLPIGTYGTIIKIDEKELRCKIDKGRYKSFDKSEVKLAYNPSSLFSLYTLNKFLNRGGKHKNTKLVTIIKDAILSDSLENIKQNAKKEAGKYAAEHIKKEHGLNTKTFRQFLHFDTVGLIQTYIGDEGERMKNYKMGLLKEFKEVEKQILKARKVIDYYQNVRI